MFVTDGRLERLDVDPNTSNKSDTPPFGAAYVGLEGVVKMLLLRLDIRTNTGDEDGNTPLFGAAGEWHKRVVKVLQLHDCSEYVT